MHERCDLCGRDALEKIYQPVDSRRGLSIYLCTHCALVQSLPRTDHVVSRERRVSAGADWGNVRYGKGFRAAEAMARLDTHINWNAPLSILDVGANRGGFINLVLAHAPNVKITAVEPDRTVVDAYTGRPNVTVLVERIEHTCLPDAQFDVIHSSHTLEHLRSPSATLTDHHRTLKPGGLLYVEVPNLQMIGAGDIVEEWFIDKHLHHYTPEVLTAQLHAAGYVIVSRHDENDLLNVSILARKEGKGSTSQRDIRSRPHEVETVQALVAAYKSNRAQACLRMRQIVARIEGLAPRRVAFWGAGRLFDALVTQGGFNPAHATAVVDRHLASHGICVADRPVEDPSVLAERKPDVLIVMSRAFADEIHAEARRLLPNCEILGYGELMRKASAEVRP